MKYTGYSRLFLINVLIEWRARSWHGRQCDPDHRVSRDERRELHLAPPLCATGTLRQHDVAAIGRAVVHAHRRRLWQCGAKLSEERARRARATRAALDILVPAGRESEDGEWVARAQGAHHEVVCVGRLVATTISLVGAVALVASTAEACH